jgi:hypothetical protein
MLSLLKEKTKIGYKPRERKKYKAYMPDAEKNKMISIQPQQPGIIQKPPPTKKINPTMLENYEKDKDKEMK